MSHNITTDGLVWCPLCQDNFQLLSVQRAAEIAAVDKRSIYRYIGEGRVNTFKIAGKRYRVCSGCLLQENLPIPQKE
jgi:hypothetical protein